jgi:DNA invertase Pin-like site-specific DNA recombinase
MEPEQPASGRLVGYARVSTVDQNLDLQMDGLRTAGCQEIFTDKASGASRSRPGLDKCLKRLARGDTLVVWRLDRLGRSLRHLLEIVGQLTEQGIGFRSVRDGAIDTTASTGKLVFHIFAALAEFERDLIRERTKAGLLAARGRGRVGGRLKVKVDNPRVVVANEMHRDQKLTVDDICRTLGISRSTFYRYCSLANVGRLRAGRTWSTTAA